MILLHSRVFLWLDDTRPAPSEWRWVKTVAEAIALAQAEDIEAMSLDHDLDDASSAGANEHESTGLAFVQWMIDTDRWPRQRPIVHSANPFGRERMVALIDKHWTRPGTKPSGPAFRHEVRSGLFLVAGEIGLVSKEWRASLSFTCGRATHLYDLSHNELAGLLGGAVTVVFVCRESEHAISLTKAEALAAARAIGPHLPGSLRWLPVHVEEAVRG